MGKKEKGILILLLAVISFLHWPLHLDLLDDPYSTILEDRRGDLLSAQIATDGQWRFPMMEELPEHFVSCITTYEDQRFFNHWGIDPISLVRAVHQNIKAKKVVSGASTISMQLVRMSRRNRKRTISQKIIEAALALKLECQYSKKEILAMYAAHAPFGGNVVGLEAASWRYYHKKPMDLSWAQMATLSVLPNAPSLVRMDRNRERLLEKRNFLLKKLHADEVLDDLDLELALDEEIEYQRHPLPRHAPHLLALAKRDGKRQQSARISTTIHSSIQQNISDVMDRHHGTLSQKEINNGAVLVIDNHTGEVVSYVGNMKRTKAEAAVDMIQARRSSGSILKPFLYAAMIEDGLITPDAFVKDAPIYIDGFSPTNYDRSYSGLVKASDALSKSLNVPFVLMLQEYGVGKFKKRLNDLGLSTVHQSADHYGLSLILGGAEVSLWQLTMAYSHMARQLIEYDDNEGAYASSSFPKSHYTKRSKESNRGLSSTSDQPTQSFSAASIYHTFEAMKRLSRPSDFGDWEQFTSSRKIAWKTGTSFGHRDAWAVGVTHDYTIGVWIGNADGEGRDEIIGVSAAGSVLFDVLDILPDDDRWFIQPYDDMEQIEVCTVTGMLPSVHCSDKEIRWLSQSSIHTAPCKYHESIWVDETEQWTVHRTCYPHDMALKKSYLHLSPLIAKYYVAHAPMDVEIPPLHPECAEKQLLNTSMEMVYPNPNERIYIPRDFDADRQKIIAQVEHSDPNIEVYWYLNGKYLGATRDFHTMSVDSQPGGYVLHCTDQNGVNAERRFEIVGE